MECVLRIEMDNPAFFGEDYRGEFVRNGDELARLLRLVADRVEVLFVFKPCSLGLRDINGNTVGSLDIEGE